MNYTGPEPVLSSWLHISFAGLSLLLLLLLPPCSLLHQPII